MSVGKLSLKLLEKEKKADFLPALEGLRFIAIGWVLLFHLAFLRNPNAHKAFQLIANPGHLGVELFFCISGFVMALPAAKRLRNGDLRYYFIRRLTRLEVPYLVALTCGFAAKVTMTSLNFTDAIKHFLASATYLHNIVYQARSVISVVTWSLEVEFQFYLLAPALWTLLIFSKSLTRLIAFIVLFTAIASSLKTGKQTFYFLLLPAYIQFFLAGALFAVLHVRFPTVVSSRRDILSLGLPLGLFFLFFTQFTPHWAHPSISLIGCCFLMTAALWGPLSKKVLSNYFVVTVGGMCYSIYLYHSFVYNALDRIWPRLGIPDSAFTTLLRTGLYITVAVAISAVFFALIERPFMKSELSRKVFSALGFQSRRASS